MYKLILTIGLIHLIQSITVQIQLPQSPNFTPSELNDLRNLRLSINSKKSVVYPTDKNNFRLPAFNNGVYFVEVLSRHFLFEALSVQVKNGQTNIYSIHPWQRKKIAKLEGQPTKIKLLSRIEYFDPESTYTLSSLLSNSYVLFLGFGVLMMLCYNNLMPKLEEAQNAVEHGNPQRRRPRPEHRPEHIQEQKQQ